MTDDGLRAEALDPATPAARLAEIAAARADLHPEILRHPACYPDLAAWIAAATPAAPVAAAPVTPAPAAATRSRSTPLVVALSAFGLALVLGVTGSLAIPPQVRVASAPPAPSPIEASADGATPEERLEVGQVLDPGPAQELAEIAGGASAPAGPSTGARATVLIFDASGSMVRDVAPGVERIDAARAATIELIQALPDEAQFGLLVFGTGTGNHDSERAAGCSDVRVFAEVGPVDRETLIAQVSGIGASGFTPIGPALRVAADQLAGAGRVIVVSDGVDTCAPPSSCEVAAELRAQHPLLTIDAVGFAVDADEQAQEALQCVAEVGGGRYYAASDATQLAARLRAAESSGEGVDPGGYRGLRLGMSYAQAALVEPALTVRRIETQIVYVDCDWATLVFDSGSLVSILPKTDTGNIDGLEPGDSVSLATAYYGEPIDSGSDDGGDYVVYQAAGAASTGYRVYVEGTTIVRIVVCVCGRTTPVTGDFSTWEISAAGVGPLRFGQSIERLPALVPAAAAMDWAYLDGNAVPYRLAPDGAGSGILLSGAVTAVNGLWASWDDEGSYGPEMTVGDRLAWINISSTTADGTPIRSAMLPRFANGIGIGSTAADVRAAFPEGSTIRGYYEFAWRYMNADGVAFDFYADGADGSTRITSITVHDYRVD